MEKFDPNNLSFLQRNRLDAAVGMYQNFWSYLTSYQDTFDILLNHLIQDNQRADTISYPMLFIARHAMELGFKTNIRYFKKYSKIDNHTNSGSHDLLDLFHVFKLHVKLTVTNLSKDHGIEVDKDDIYEFNKYCAHVEELTKIFHDLDKNSDSFRYPVNKQNKNSFESHVTISIIDVKELLDKSMMLFLHTSDVFSEYINFADEIAAMFESEMKDYLDYYEK